MNPNGRAVGPTRALQPPPRIVTFFQAEGVTPMSARAIDPSGSHPTIDNAIESQIEALAFRRASRTRVAAQAYMESITPVKQQGQARLAPPPPPRHQQVPPIPTAAHTLPSPSQAMITLDNAFRGYADKFQQDMANLRLACTRAVYSEQQDKERLKTRCLGFKHELDIVRQKMRALMSERDALVAMNNSGNESEGRGVKRSRGPENAEGVQESIISASRSPSPVEPASASSSISSSSTPPQSGSLPPSSASSSVLRSPFKDNESRAFRIRLSSKRRSSSECPPPSASISPSPPSPALSSASCPSLDLPSLRNRTPAFIVPYKLDGTAFEVTDVPGETMKVRRPRKKRRQVEVEDGEIVVKGLGEHDMDTDNDSEGSSKASSVSQPTSPQIEVTHVDLMYVPAKGVLTCRACLFDYNKSGAVSKAKEPQTFPTDAMWDELRDHCVKEHPSACADVARLHPAEIYELRRRLAQMSRAM